MTPVQKMKAKKMEAADARGNEVTIGARAAIGNYK